MQSIEEPPLLLLLLLYKALNLIVDPLTNFKKLGIIRLGEEKIQIQIHPFYFIAKGEPIFYPLHIPA